MGCGESLYNYINRQIKKISEKQHNFIELQDRVNTNIFIKLDEINERLLDIGQGNNVDSILKEIEKLTTDLNIVKENVSEISQNNSVMFNNLNSAILEIKNKDAEQGIEINQIKNKDTEQDLEINQINEKVSDITTKLNLTTNIAQTNEKSISNLTKKFDVYETNTDAKFENINNTLNSVEVKTLNVNTASFANVQQFIFQKKIVNIVGLFRTAHSQTGDSQLIQINNPYPSRIVHFVGCDRNTGKALGCYINQTGVINIPLNYEGDKDIYLNVCYIV